MSSLRCRQFVISIAAGLFLSLAGCCKPDPIGSQVVALSAQQTDMWCWAASGKMIMDFLGTPVTQCDEANRRFGRNDCCNGPTPNDCVNGGWPEFDKYGFTFKVTADTALTWDQVKDQIFCKKKPFAFSWHWPGGGGHMMVATGYVTAGNVNYVSVNNPWPPNTGDQYVHTYDDYVSGVDHTHWNDYYDVTKQ
jgi:hypothetical protein